jgi:prevent-host-death family protein
MLVYRLIKAIPMLEEIDFIDVKAKLSEILRRVEAGEAFAITNRGKPIADVIPSRVSDRLKTEAAIANILKAKKHKMSDTVLAELKGAGR